MGVAEFNELDEPTNEGLTWSLELFDFFSNNDNGVKIRDALSANYKHSDKAGVSTTEFAVLVVKKFLKENYSTYQANLAAEEARKLAIVDASVAMKDL